jgi:hypothetical protein
MTNTPTNIVNTGAMPTQDISAMPAGATSPMNAGMLKQQEQIDQHMALIGNGKSGGSKRNQTKRDKLIGGTVVPVVQVPQVQSGSVNPQATSSNYTDLTKLSQNIQTGAAFDEAKTPAQTAGIAAQQQALYKGGSYRKGKRGGSWPVWGCLSGGKKSRKRRGKKSCKCKKGKNKRTKRHHH